MIAKLKQKLLVLTVRIALRAARLFWRVRYVDKPDDSKMPHLYAHWHGDELLLLPIFAHQQYAVISSRSRDGEVMAKLLESLGYFVVRGSSSRGGAGALKGLIDAVLKRNLSASIAVDGPRGPVHQVKPGILYLAQATGLPVVPAAGASSRAWRIRGAWNKGFVPKPFSKCVIVFGAPLLVPKECSDSEFENVRRELQRRLDMLKTSAGDQVAPTKTPFFKRVALTPPSASSELSKT